VAGMLADIVGIGRLVAVYIGAVVCTGVGKLVAGMA